jgi:hypothetical protein
VLGDDVREPLRLGAEETRAGEERDPEEGKADRDPVVAEAPGASTTMKTPLAKASSDEGVRTRFAIHSTSTRNRAARSPPATVARIPKNWIISAPPTQMTAIAMWMNSRTS